MRKTKILAFKGNWQEVVNDCRVTVDKPPLGKEPSDKFKRDMMVCEHTPIRRLSVSFLWENLHYWVAMHFKTPTWYSVVTSQRDDRQNKYKRGKAPQDAPVTFTGEPNAQHLIDTSRKRLCYQASPETREMWEDLKITVGEEVDEHMAWAMVPNCIYRGGCPEPCICKEQHYFKLLQKDPHIGSCDIKQRYDAYNKLFYQMKGIEK